MEIISTIINGNVLSQLLQWWEEGHIQHEWWPIHVIPFTVLSWNALCTHDPLDTSDNRDHRGCSGYGHNKLAECLVLGVCLVQAAHFLSDVIIPCLHCRPSLWDKLILTPFRVHVTCHLRNVRVISTWNRSNPPAPPFDSALAFLSTLKISSPYL